MPRKRKRRSRRKHNEQARKRRRLEPEPCSVAGRSSRPKLYRSDDPVVLNDPRIKAILDRIRAHLPSPTREGWYLPEDQWRWYLKDYPDREYVDIVLERNATGWPTTCNEDWKCYGEREEYPATIEHILEGLTKIEQRMDKKYIWGGFPDAESLPAEFGENYATWPLFYKDEADKVRLLINMSCNSKGVSLNEHLVPEEKHVSYVTILELVRWVVSCGLRWLWCADAYEAYYRVPVEGKMIPLLGVKLCGFFFFFTCLVMGFAASSKVYTEFADVVAWMCVHQDLDLMQHKEAHGKCVDLLKHYVDDFIGGHRHYASALLQFALLRRCWSELGLPPKLPKCHPPSQDLAYIGYVWHTIARTPLSRGTPGCLSIIPKRLVRYVANLRSVCAGFDQRGEVAGSDFRPVVVMQAIVGQVRSTALVFPFLAPFLRRTERITSLCSDNSRRMRITGAINRDFRYVVSILSEPSRNFISFDWLLGRRADGYRFDVTVFTDASTTRGVGGYVAVEGGVSPKFTTMWSDSLVGVMCRQGHGCADITYYEMLGVVVAVRLYGAQWEGKSVRFFCDNKAVCYCVGKKCACFKRPDLNWLLEQLARMVHEYRFRCWIWHIDGVLNGLSDALSRNIEITDAMLQKERVPYDIELACEPTPSREAVDYLMGGFYEYEASMVRRWRGRRNNVFHCECDSLGEKAIRFCKKEEEAFKQWSD